MIRGFRQSRLRYLLPAVFIGGACAWALVAWHPVQAQTASTFSIESVGQQVGLGNADLRQVAINIIRWLLGFVTLIAVAYLVYGGYLWMTAAGNEQRVEKAKQVILQAVIGLVIIILAWAIVLFVARTVAETTNTNNTNGGGGGGCIGFECLSTPKTFDLTGVTTCSARPDYAKNVPRASAVSLTFNHDIDIATVQAAVTDAVAANPNLVIEKCDAGDCANRTTLVKPLQNQVYSGTTPKGAAGTPLSEWVTHDNTVTFYHTSFSTDENNSDNLYFEPNTTYQLTVPAKDAPTALKDTTSPGRSLQKCQANSARQPIEGDGFLGENCREVGDTIVWTFTTGSDIDGPELTPRSTTPTSGYLTGNGVPDRNVSRTGIIGIDFNNAIDPASITTDNFIVTKYTTAPDATNGTGGTLDATALPASDFVIRVNGSGTGGWLQLKAGNLFDPFTWYQVRVKDVRNLCGTAQNPNPYEWVFETNDTVPGVKLVYPKNDAKNICPSTEVFIKFSTSMWRIDSGSTTCQPASGGSYVTNGTLAPNPGRGFVVEDELDPNNPNNSCTKYAFTPTETLLTPDKPHTASVTTSLVINQDGNTLNRNWTFTTSKADQCIQEPYIDRVEANTGTNGQCVSVIGNYFEKQPPGGTRETDGQGSDKLFLSTVDQKNAKSWKQNVIVSTVNDGTPDSPALVPGPQPYKVVLDYGGTIGQLESNTVDFNLQAGGGTLGVCLVGVTPDQGPAGTNTTLSGEGFGGFGANSAVTFSGGPNWGVAAGNWSDGRISPAQVPTTTPDGSGLVRVQTNGGALSNPVPFTVTVPNTGGGGGDTVPRVEESAQCNIAQNEIPSPNPKRNDNQACLNTQVSARFTLDMDQNSLNSTNIFLQKCDPVCTTAVASSVVATGLRGFTLTPDANLEPSTRYQVTVTTGVQSNASPAVPMAGPYTWQFTTKADGANCAPAGVTVSSNSAFGNAIQSSATRYTYSDPVPYGVNLTANVVDAECRTLIPGSLSFAWGTTDQSVATLTPNDAQTILAHSPATPVAGSSNVNVKVDQLTSANVQINYDPVSCQTDSDCASNTYGACSGSTCENNRCTPVVTELTPTTAPIGDLMTIKGCWFGDYDDTISQVTFLGQSGTTDDQSGIIPDSAICGPASNTWTNERIVREIPNRTTPDPSDDAVTGPVEVTRFDNKLAQSPSDYVPTNDNLSPGICAVNPSSGLTGTAVTVKGFRFGADESNKRPTNDQVNITRIGGNTAVMSVYGNWSDTSIGTQIPPSAAVGASNVKVKNDDVDSSNDWPFTVTDTGATTCAQYCSNDNQCGAGQGCGTDFCCSARPKVTGTSPSANATNVCRNSQLDLTFDQPLAVQSGAVVYSDGGTPVSGSTHLQNSSTTGTLSYQPGLLQPDSSQLITLNPNAIRSLKGVTASNTFPTDCTLVARPRTQPNQILCYQTGKDICQIDQIRVRTEDGLNTHRFTSVDEVMQYRAEALSNRDGGTVIVPVPGTYAWTWSWQSANSTIATVGLTSGASANPSTSDVTAKSNGRTLAQATATITEDTQGNSTGTQKNGSGEAIVDVCDNPWSFTDANDNCDSGGTCNDFHFTLSYCQGQDSADLLPYFSYTGSNAQLGAIEGQNSADTSRLKSIFFKETASSKDVIGMLIFDNPDLLSPYDWFKQRFPLDTGGSSSIIAGYPAFRTGTTTYIGITDLSGGTLTGRMVVLDYNSNNASTETQNIYNQIVTKAEFNTNVTDITEKQQILNDTKRVQDLASLKTKLAAYKTAHGSYPSLQAGTYIIGLSASTWPSWQQTLGNELGQSAPTDPTNTFAPDCKQNVGGSYENQTCWSESLKQFQCPADSYVYLYRSSGDSYTLSARMEYQGTGNFQQNAGLSDSCSGVAGAQCSCFNYRVTP